MSSSNKTLGFLKGCVIVIVLLIIFLFFAAWLYFNYDKMSEFQNIALSKRSKVSQINSEISKLKEKIKKGNSSKKKKLEVKITYLALKKFNFLYQAILWEASASDGIFSFISNESKKNAFIKDNGRNSIQIAEREILKDIIHDRLQNISTNDLLPNLRKFTKNFQKDFKKGSWKNRDQLEFDLRLLLSEYEAYYENPEKFYKSNSEKDKNNDKTLEEIYDFPSD